MRTYGILTSNVHADMHQSARNLGLLHIDARLDGMMFEERSKKVIHILRSNVRISEFECPDEVLYVGKRVRIAMKRPV